MSSLLFEVDGESNHSKERLLNAVTKSHQDGRDRMEVSRGSVLKSREVIEILS